MHGTFGLVELPLQAEQPSSVSMWDDAEDLLVQTCAARRTGPDAALVGVHWGGE